MVQNPSTDTGLRKTMESTDTGLRKTMESTDTGLRKTMEITDSLATQNTKKKVDNK